MTILVISLTMFLLGCACCWYGNQLLDRAQRTLYEAQREREEAEVEHWAAEWYWAKATQERQGRQWE